MAGKTSFASVVIAEAAAYRTSVMAANSNVKAQQGPRKSLPVLLLLLITMSNDVHPLNTTTEEPTDGVPRKEVVYITGKGGSQTTLSSEYARESSVLGLVAISLVAFVVATAMIVAVWKCFRAYQEGYFQHCCKKRAKPLNSLEENRRRLGIYKSVRLSKDIEILSSSSWDLYQRMTSTGTSRQESHVTRVSVLTGSPAMQSRHVTWANLDGNNNTSSPNTPDKLYLAKLLTPKCASVQSGYSGLCKKMKNSSESKNASIKHLVVEDIVPVTQLEGQRFPNTSHYMGIYQSPGCIPNKKRTLNHIPDKDDPASLVVHLYTEKKSTGQHSSGRRKPVAIRDFMETSV